MKMVIDVQADKADLIREVLSYFPFVNIQTSTSSSKRVLKELEEAVKELQLIKKGQLEGVPAEDLLHEL